MWYELKNTDNIISPSLLFYKDRIENNIDRMINIAGDADRLIPHVKTHKTAEIVRLQLQKGIFKFKCATIAEAEMLADAGVNWVLIAYQMVGPNMNRLVQLRKKFPECNFSTLIDNERSAELLNNKGVESGLNFTVFIDVNNGMNRSGHPVDGSILSLFNSIKKLANLLVEGVHIYDGHIRNPGISERKQEVDAAFEQTTPLITLLNENLNHHAMIIAGGSPSFNIHSLRSDVFLSPGTNVLWDWGYGSRFQDQPFLHGALILTRVVSKPSLGIVTIDLGHKSIAAENLIDNRFQLLNLSNYEILGQSEEHGVLQVSEEEWENIQIGDVYYALPYHICPSVALHDYATVIEDGEPTEEWKIVARNRKITI
jgi:D-serine deaminase-like pyridoxal phosphate-dependent protein